MFWSILNLASEIFKFLKTQLGATRLRVLFSDSLLEYDDLPQFGLTGQSKSKFNSARKAAFGSVIELSLSSIGRHQLAKIQRQSRRLKLQLMVY